ncbi:hypothetical protein C2E23DRAFT_248279 [Lenzites betulinus]|nr:hypothetical protein C2E23DRAFT_248279 [Lenzites betulinus]
MHMCGVLRESSSEVIWAAHLVLFALWPQMRGGPSLRARQSRAGEEAGGGRCAECTKRGHPAVALLERHERRRKAEGRLHRFRAIRY